jgi:hypothetical protein
VCLLILFLSQGKTVLIPVKIHIADKINLVLLIGSRTKQRYNNEKLMLTKWDKCLSNLAIALNKYFTLERKSVCTIVCIVLDYFSIIFSLEIDPLLLISYVHSDKRTFSFEEAKKFHFISILKGKNKRNTKSHLRQFLNLNPCHSQ